MNISIIYQDDDITIVEKPSGVVVNRSQTVASETVEDWFRTHLKEVSHAPDSGSSESWRAMLPADFTEEYGSPEEIFSERGGIVHRLDKETSGLLLLANHPGSLIELLRQFRTRMVQKRYTCLVHGKFSILEDTLQLPLGRSSDNRTKFSVDAEGRQAETKYQVQQFFAQIDDMMVKTQGQKNLHKKLLRGYQGFSLVSCWPKTGRTHQIRVHMAAITHPLVADVTYLGKKRRTLDALWCPRLFLHASEIQFVHPRTKKLMQFPSALPEDLRAALAFLKE